MDLRLHLCLENVPVFLISRKLQRRQMQDYHMPAAEGDGAAMLCGSTHGEEGLGSKAAFPG